MKDNPLFNCDAVCIYDPIDLDIGEATDEVIQAMANVYDESAGVLGVAVVVMATRWSTYDGGLWGFVTSLDGRTGFWYPLDADAYAVDREDNDFTHDYMPATAFGAGLSVAALRSFVEFQAEQRFHKLAGALDDQSFVALQDKYDALRDFVLDLAQDKLIDGESFLAFID